MKKILLVFILVFFAYNKGICQTKSIIDCLEIIEFNIWDYSGSDIGRLDTILDIPSGYFEIIDGTDKLIQATKFNNKDGSVLLAITGYYNDCVCSNYNSKFFEISKSSNKITPINSTDLIPLQYILEFKPYTKAWGILNRNLPSILENFPKCSTLNDFLAEEFPFHISLPRKGTSIEINIDMCNYVLSEEYLIKETDINHIANQDTTLILIYNNELKQFEKPSTF